MNPRSGENPLLISNSRSQSWRAVRSQEGHSRECAFSSLIRSGWATRLTSSPPWGGIRWLVEAVKSLNLPGPFRFLLDYCCLDYFSRRRDCDGAHVQMLKGLTLPDYYFGERCTKCSLKAYQVEVDAIQMPSLALISTQLIVNGTVTVCSSIPDTLIRAAMCKCLPTKVSSLHFGCQHFDRPRGWNSLEICRAVTVIW